jgi:hypothetical protein
MIGDVMVAADHMAEEIANQQQLATLEQIELAQALEQAALDYLAQLRSETEVRA